MELVLPTDSASIRAFDAAFIASLPAEQQAIMKMWIEGTPDLSAPGIHYTDRVAILNACQKLTTPFLSDIVKLGSDPYLWHLSRYNQGFRCYPNGFQDAPHNTNGWTDAENMPPGALLVSPFIEDYKPAIDPTAVAPPPPSIIGNPFGYSPMGDGRMGYAAGVIPGIPIKDQPHFAEGYQYTLQDGVKTSAGISLPAGVYTYHVLNPGVIEPSMRIAVWLK